MSNNVMKKESVLLDLASGKTAREAAKSNGLNERTILRWRKNRSFRRRETTLRRELFRTAFCKLSATSNKAADAIDKLLESDSESICLGAARTVLQLVNEFRKTFELEQEVKELNQRLDKIEAMKEKT